MFFCTHNLDHNILFQIANNILFQMANNVVSIYLMLLLFAL